MLVRLKANAEHLEKQGEFFHHVLDKLLIK